MPEKYKLLLSTVCLTLMSGAYWFVFWNVAYGLTGGDYRPGPGAPTDHELGLRLWAILGAGFVVYAAIMWFWRAMDFRIRGRSIR